MVKLRKVEESKSIQGLDPDLYSYEDVINSVLLFIKERLLENDLQDIKIIDAQLHGSRLRGQAKKRSDLDAVVQYDGDIREDDLYNILNSKPVFKIEGIKVDINPIKEDMKSYMKRSDDYDKKKLGMV